MTAAVAEGSQVSGLHDVPRWATPGGVAAIIAVYLGTFAAVALLTRSALGVDDATQNAIVQELRLTYADRNPPLFDWIIWAVQQLLGPGQASFTLVRYTLLFACALLVYRVAQRVIEDPRLQAIGVFSLSLLWIVGYHAHRTMTHSNVMIVGIAGTVLAVLLLREQRTAARYAMLGVFVLIGLFGKFGFVAFLAALLVAMVLQRSFGDVLLDARMAGVVVAVGVPTLLYMYAARAEDYDFAYAVTYVVQHGRESTLAVLGSITTSGLGYLLPFLPLFLLTFFARPQWKSNSPDPIRDSGRRLLRDMLLAGTAIFLIGVFASGTTVIHTRYFHVFYLLAPVYAFAEADRLVVRRDQIRACLLVLLCFAGGIATFRTVLHLAPHPRICDECRDSVPYAAFGRALAERHGDRLVLVAETNYHAGQLRAAMPGAEVLAVRWAEQLGPAPAGSKCYLIRQDDLPEGRGGGGVDAAADGAGLDLGQGETIAIRWWAPLLFGAERETHWTIKPISLNHPACPGE